MSTFEKMKKQILQQKCRIDFMPAEIQSFLKKYGFVHKSTNGSHYIYEYYTKNKTYMLNVVMHKPLDPANIYYIKKTINQIEEEKENE